MMMNLFNFYYYDRIGYIATTRAFIPFIFEIFIFIAYFICNTVLVEKDGRIESLELNIEKKNKRINQSENMRIELLEKYKELMDKGIITQEEFFEKKKQLLR